MRLNKAIMSGLCVMAVLLTSACGGGGKSSNDGGDDGGSNGGGDSNGGVMPMTSHRAGEDCMSSGCHNVGNGSNTEFAVAGTIFRSGGGAQNNATVMGYLSGSNTIVVEMDTDDSGNFYTTETIEGLSRGDGVFVQGVDFVVMGPNETRSMPAVLTSGSCGVCHGMDNGDIRVN